MVVEIFEEHVRGRPVSWRVKMYSENASTPLSGNNMSSLLQHNNKPWIAMNQICKRINQEATHA